MKNAFCAALMVLLSLNVEAGRVKGSQQVTANNVAETSSSNRCGGYFFDVNNPLHLMIGLLMGSTMISVAAAVAGGVSEIPLEPSCTVNATSLEHLCKQNTLTMYEANYSCSVNQMFIPEHVRTAADGAFLFGCGTLVQQQLQLRERLIEPMMSWLSAMRQRCRYNFWVDSEATEASVIENSREYICKELHKANINTDNAYLNDIRTLREVKDNPKLFSVARPIYWRTDNARNAVAIHELEVHGYDFVIYADLDRLLESFDKIFSKKNLAIVARHGFAMHRPKGAKDIAPSPAFFILSKAVSIPEIREFLINRALYEMQNFAISEDFRVFVPTMTNLWFVAKERPHLLTKLLSIRQSTLSTRTDFPKAFAEKYASFTGGMAINKEFEHAMQQLKAELDAGRMSKKKLVKTVLGDRAFKALAELPQFLSIIEWMTSTSYEMFDELLVYAHLYKEMGLDDAEFHRFLMTFPMLEGIIDTAINQPFETKCGNH